MQDEKLPINFDRRKSDVLVVLENNRNGRTKCYSTSAAALIGPKPSSRVQSPVKVAAPLVEPVVGSQEIEEKDAALAASSEMNGTTMPSHQQTNELPSTSPSSPVLVPIPSELLQSSMTILSEGKPVDSSNILSTTRPDILSTMPNGKGEEKVGEVGQQSRNETSI